MNTKLKIKIKSLAAESTIIRTEELKIRNAARKMADYSDGVAATKRLRDTLRSIHDHRVGILRRHARENQLAYGFLRGRTYQRLENTTKSTPYFEGVYKVVRRFSDASEGGNNELENRFDEWVSTAEKYIKHNTSIRNALK